LGKWMSKKKTPPWYGDPVRVCVRASSSSLAGQLAALDAGDSTENMLWCVPVGCAALAVMRRDSRVAAAVLCSARRSSEGRCWRMRLPLCPGARHTRHKPTLRAHDGGHPLIDVVALGSGRAVGRGVQADFSQLLLDPLGRAGQLGALHGDDAARACRSERL
jgi:hypothetical protein